MSARPTPPALLAQWLSLLVCEVRGERLLLTIILALVRSVCRGEGATIHAPWNRVRFGDSDRRTERTAVAPADTAGGSALEATGLDVSVPGSLGGCSSRRTGPRVRALVCGR